MQLIAAIKHKKEFSALPDEFIQEKLDAYFKTHGKERKTLEASEYNEKSKVFKQVVKDIRADLREIYGVFQKAGNEKRKKLLQEYFAAKGRGEKLVTLDKLLQSHQSTKERKDYYKEVYDTIFTEKPEHILDLGCGFNPLAYQWLPGEPIYDCCDLSTEDMQLIEAFFAKRQIRGNAFKLDLMDANARKQLQDIPADTVFMFKLIDTLETQQRNVTKDIIKELEQNKTIKHIIASFPLQSIGGTAFRQGGKENWFSRFLKEEQLDWKRVEVAGEEFYLIDL